MKNLKEVINEALMYESLPVNSTELVRLAKTIKIYDYDYKKAETPGWVILQTNADDNDGETIYTENCLLSFEDTKNIPGRKGWEIFGKAFIPRMYKELGISVKDIKQMVRDEDINGFHDIMTVVCPVASDGSSTDLMYFDDKGKLLSYEADYRDASGHDLTNPWGE